MSEVKPVFIGVQKGEYIGVMHARDYQTSAFNTFMSNNNIVKIEFEYPGKHGNIKFNLKKFYNAGVEGDYSRFCILENESGEHHILSDNEQLLRFYVNKINKVFDQRSVDQNFGGSKRKPVTKRKPIKKK